jgi:hypothetical protein
MVKTHCFLELPQMGEKDDKIYTKFPPNTNLQERKQIHPLLEKKKKNKLCRILLLICVYLTQPLNNHLDTLTFSLYLHTHP